MVWFLLSSRRRQVSGAPTPRLRASPTSPGRGRGDQSCRGATQAREEVRWCLTPTSQHTVGGMGGSAHSWLRWASWLVAAAAPRSPGPSPTSPFPPPGATPGGLTLGAALSREPPRTPSPPGCDLNQSKKCPLLEISSSRETDGFFEGFFDLKEMIGYKEM